MYCNHSVLPHITYVSSHHIRFANQIRHIVRTVTLRCIVFALAKLVCVQFMMSIKHADDIAVNFCTLFTLGELMF